MNYFGIGPGGARSTGVDGRGGSVLVERTAAASGSIEIGPVGAALPGIDGPVGAGGAAGKPGPLRR